MAHSAGNAELCNGASNSGDRMMDGYIVPGVSIEQNTPLIDIATRNVIRLAPGDSMGEAARIMAEKRISSIMVMDENDHPAGIVTEHDMLRAMQSGCPREKALREIMSSPITTMAGSVTCLEAYQICLRDGIRHLAIVDDDGRVSGVVSETDFRMHINLAALAGHRQVVSVMNRSVFSLPPDAGLREALNLMQSHRDTCVVVVEDGRPVGIVTERDIVRLYSGDPGRDNITVGEVMTSPVLTITLDSTINEAAGRMLAAKVRHLVVVDREGGVAGLICEHGLTHSMALNLIDDKLVAEGAFLHTLVNTIPDLVWLKDVNGVYLACNPRFERFFGAREKDIVGKTDYDFVNRELADFFREHDRIAMEKNGVSVNEEWVTFADDGHRELLETIKTPMRDGTGKSIGVLGIARDISERIKAEEMVRKLSIAVEQSAASVVIADLDARIQYVNPHFTENTGYSAAEVIGRNSRILQSGQTAKEVYRDLWSKLTSGQEWNGELLNKRKNGELYWEDASIAPVKNPEGVVTHYVAVKTEITARKKMEAALAESEYRFRMLVENSPFCIHEIDLEGRLQSMNRAGLGMMGLDDEKKVRGVPYLSAVSAQDSGRIKALLQDAFNGTASHFEFAAAGDTPLYFKSCFIPIKDAGGKVLKLMGITEDITERKRMEDALYFVAQRGWQDRSENYFDALAQYLGKSLGVDYVIIDRMGEDHHRAETVALYAKGAIIPNMHYSLKGTPCENVMGGEFCCYRQGVQQLFPDDALLAEMGIESYTGMPLWDSSGQTIGLIAVMDSKPLPDGEAVLAPLLKIVAARAAAELERKRSEDALLQQKQLSDDIINSLPGIFYMLDAEGRFVRVNPQFLKVTGYAREELERMTALDLFEGNDRNRIAQRIQEVFNTGVSWAEAELIIKSGRSIPYYFTGHRIVIDGQLHLVGLGTDITERKRAEESLRITASVFDNSQEAVVISDASNIIVDVNPAFTRITGYAREEVLGKNPKLLSSGRQDQAFYAEMWQALKQDGSWRGEIWNRRKGGEVYAEMLSVSAICDDAGKVLRYVGVFSDISHLKAHEAELSRVAYYDALTGIPNRALLADRMKQAIAQTSREQVMMAVCYIDLDGFKQVNDTLGHEAGDQVLIEVAKRIGATIRGGDTVARLGGDEFVVVLLGLERGDECVATLERLLAAIAQPITVKGQLCEVSASIGVSIYPLDDEAPDTLLRHADQAMYVAKQSGKDRYYIYDPALDLRARGQFEFLKSVRLALQNNQFELYYQPKVDLRSKQLVGAEALIRWRHPERGLLAPAEFLHAIENTELDIELGDWVIATALAQNESWRKAGLDIEVSINVSAHHLESHRFAEKLQQQIERYPDMPPGMFQIEVLETAALNDFAIVRKVIETCRKLGVRFALDDFGTGYSSLSYLSHLPVDVLKIDQSFVHRMLEDKGDNAIIKGVLAMAQAFSRQTVVEGIENEEQYRALLDMGCEIGQGYAIARPMQADDLVNWKAG